MTGESENNRSEGQGGFREELSTKEVCSKGTTVGKRTEQRGRARAMSVLGNAKSDQHRKTRTVEADGTGRKFMHLTRGDPRCESSAEVSRGRSSEEACRKVGGAKGRRTTERATETGLRRKGGESSETRGERQLRQLPALARPGGTAGVSCGKTERTASQEPRERKRKEHAQ
jgi:hypothetical protein